MSPNEPTNDFKKLIEDRPIRIAILDIETSGLDADFGYVMCACLKRVNEKNLRGKTTTIRIDDPKNPDQFNDKWVVKKLIDEMNRYDLIVHWYGSRFDIPFINTRALLHKLRPPVKNFRRDLCFVARGIGKLKNNRLATWGRFLFGKSGKTFLSPQVWLQAMRNNKESLDYVVYHCEKDVLETERIYKKFMPMMGKLKRR